MKKLKFLSKLKNQKGITGVDIVVSITVITLTIAVVTAIYVNIDLTSKKVTRTAGATRIATNIFEEIEKMTYSDFKTEIDNNSPTNINGIQRIVINRKKGRVYENEKFFNTKIPKGYLVECSIENAYGTDTEKKYDIVKKIKLLIEYPVGDRTESVELSTVKALEMIEICNKPIISEDNFIKYPSIEMSDVIPIKKDGSVYRKIKNENDFDGWYSYENKVWAKVIVGNSHLDSATGQLNEGFENDMYVWIPNFGIYNGELTFRYKNTKNMIKNEILEKLGETKNTYTVTNDIANDRSSCTFQTNGYWIKYTDLNSTYSTGNSYIKSLNESEYGPLEL